MIQSISEVGDASAYVNQKGKYLMFNSAYY